MSSQLPSIPPAEFASRRQRAQQLVREAALDALLVHSNEAEMANVRYFSDYWPIFEAAGVLIPAEGEAIEYERWVRSRGYGEYLLYGPCHGLGIIEV